MGFLMPDLPTAAPLSSDSGSKEINSSRFKILSLILIFKMESIPQKLPLSRLKSLFAAELEGKTLFQPAYRGVVISIRLSRGGMSLQGGLLTRLPPPAGKSGF